MAKDVTKYEQPGKVVYEKTEGITVVQHGGSLFYHITNPQLIAALKAAGVAEAAPGHVLLEVNMANSMGLADMGVNMQGLESVRYTAQWPLYNGLFPIGDHQIATAAFIINNRRCMVANEQRTGKTFSFIAANMVLQEMRARTATLIIAPLTLLELVWEREIKLSDPNADVRVLRAQAAVYAETTKAGRKKVTRKMVKPAQTAEEVLIEAWNDMRTAQSTAPYDNPKAEANRVATSMPYLIMDPDSLRHNEILRTQLCSMLSVGAISVVGIDESTYFANYTSGRTQALNTLINSAVYENLRVILMTGTPGNPAKVYAQSKICDPRRCYVSEENWESKTIIYGNELATPYAPGDKRNPRKKIARPNWIQNVLHLTPPIIRFETNDVIDVTVNAPETIHTTLTEEQRKAYELAVRESLLIFENAKGEPTAKEIEHSMTKITKARQISLGTYLTDEGEVVELDYTERLNDIISIIKAAKKKTIVFTSYTAPTYRLAKDLAARGIKNVVITGDITDGATVKERTAAADAFQNDDSVRVMLAHPQTVAYGVEASAGNTIIWNGPVAEGAETYSQGCSRCSSVKQDEEVFIYHLVATAYEEAGFVSLDSALSEREVLLNLARDMTRKGTIR